MNNSIYFDLDTPYFDLNCPLSEPDEADITEVIKLKVSEYLQNEGLIKSNNFLGTIEENLGYFSSNRNMLSVVGEKDSNFGVFSNDVSTLFLGVTKDFIDLKELTNLNDRKDWYKFNITEHVLISDRPRKQSSLYLNAFSSWGLQPYGEIKWRSFNGRIVFCEVRNADGSWYINKIKQEIANAS